MTEACDTKETGLAKDDPELRMRQRADLIRRTICPKGISQDEFDLFLEQCVRSGLDPLLKEAFCVPLGGQHVFQPSEAGMLARAHRFPDFKGIQASAVFAEDEVLVDQGKGEVLHRFNPAKRKGQLVGAWARVERTGKLPVVVWLDFGGYVQKSPLWSKIPTTMIEKCARVAALRKAFPEAFGGLYIREEMPAEEVPEEYKEPAQQQKTKRSRKAEPEDAVVEATPPALPPPDPLTEKQRADLDAQVDAARASLERQRVQEGAVRTDDELDLLNWGPSKSKRISTLTREQLERAIGVGTDNLERSPKAKWAGTVHKQIALMQERLVRLGEAASAEVVSAPKQEAANVQP